MSPMGFGMRVDELQKPILWCADFHFLLHYMTTINQRYTTDGRTFERHARSWVRHALDISPEFASSVGGIWIRLIDSYLGPTWLSIPHSSSIASVGPNLTKFINNTEKLSFNYLKYWNCDITVNSMTNEARWANFANFASKIGCHGNAPWGIARWMTSLSSATTHLKSWKFGKDRSSWFSIVRLECGPLK